MEQGEKSWKCVKRLVILTLLLSQIGTSTGTGIVRPKENTANRSTRLTNTEDDGNQDGFFDYGLGFS